MDNNKRDSHSNNRVDFDRESTADEHAQNMDPFETDQDCEALFEAISRIQAVRVPGVGRVSPPDAIAVAIDQGEAFKRWCRKGAPLEDIEAWVDGRRVMTARPESRATLLGFKFKVPSPDAAVLQLTTRALGEITVLFNLLLRHVPENGWRHREDWPNGQSMTLYITRSTFTVATAAAGAGSMGRAEKMGEFYIKVAIGLAEGQSQSDGRDSYERTEQGIQKQATPVIPEKPKAMAALAAALAVGILFIGLVLLFRFNSNPPVAEAKSQERPGPMLALAAEPGLAEMSPGAGAIAESDVIDPVPSDFGAVSERQSVTNANEGKSRISSRDNVSKLSDLKAAIVIRQPQASELVSSVGITSLPTPVYPRLAALKNMYVDTKAEPIKLRSHFIQALEASKRFNVLAEGEQLKADGVITLGFEPQSPCLGVVFVKVTSRDGNFLWGNYAWEATPVCRTVPVSQDKIFNDASIALVDSLESTVRQAEANTRSKDTSSTDGG